MSDEYETVHTMTDYYDGPRGGIAEVNGRPHLYTSTWADIDPDQHHRAPPRARTSIWHKTDRAGARAGSRTRCARALCDSLSERFLA